MSAELIDKYPWADNITKLEEAIKRSSGGDEKVVFDWYVKLAGKVVNGGLEGPVEEVVETPKPKRKAKKEKKVGKAKGKK